jgi:hypothetical protein
LGLEIIHDKVPQDVFNLAAANAHEAERFAVDPSIYSSWDYKITTYVAHRTDDRYRSLAEQMKNVLLDNFFDEEQKDKAKMVDTYLELNTIINRRKGTLLGNIALDPISLDEADTIAANLGAKAVSPKGHSRKKFMQLLLNDAETEAALIKAGINPNAVSEKTIPMPKWEDDLRLQYVEAAEPDILAELYTLEHQARKGNQKAKDIFSREYSGKDWWIQYARRLYEEWKGEKIDTTATTYTIFSSKTTDRKRRITKPTRTIHPDQKYL